jgi:hypothetical protein
MTPLLEHHFMETTNDRKVKFFLCKLVLDASVGTHRQSLDLRQTKATGLTNQLFKIDVVLLEIVTTVNLLQIGEELSFLWLAG